MGIISTTLDIYEFYFSDFFVNTASGNDIETDMAPDKRLKLNGECGNKHIKTIDISITTTHKIMLSLANFNFFSFENGLFGLSTGAKENTNIKVAIM